MPDLFAIEKQREDKWCWAAVSASVDRYFRPDSLISQCRVARQVTGKRHCCANPDDCNLPEDLEAALRAAECWKETHEGILSFERIMQEIDAGRPICARIGWRAGGGHFVIVTGYRLLASGAQQVEVADPFFADSIMTYNQFVNAYGSAEEPGGGQWTRTFFVQPNAGKKEGT